MQKKFWESQSILEAKGILNCGICGCGRQFLVDEFHNDAHLKSQHHRDTCFKVCQYLWKVGDVIDVLSMTRLHTADMIFINLIISFVEDDPWGNYRVSSYRNF